MTEGGTSARSDLWGGAGWAGFGLLIVVLAWRMERFESMGAELYTMPGFVPGMLGGVLLLLGTVLMLRSWHRSRQHAGTEPTAPLFNRRITIMLALSLAYAVGLIGRVPFWLATAVFVAVFVATFAPPEQAPARRLMVALLAGVLTSAVVTFVFQQIFLVRLP
ncbi:tripartite tricarboxylate transporter TctB family protein [Hydrogenophaga sp.]|uniref:tripartite tricarboxylate transporter TctB family protein n=1 Tax=Hydrogenophaga sp. TaxID=1904254 RepID=UPI0027305A70|nr:tripartite tricarboxylate transporter TctB family protein [Hydrogenophaga sp.]MDP2017394.1 tripartite tricarboxylate transporter TctB family protein [Hydrogenophaga sp.]MDP3164083.1 tripartite tricarboxylate transporter TctB family protein [Hydrogenophaga sp.]